MKTLEQALSLAAIAKVELDRAQWMRTYGSRVSEEQVALSQAYFDELRSKALTLSLADATVEELLA